MKRSDFPKCCGSGVEIMEERKGIDYKYGKQRKRVETSRQVFYRCQVCHKKLKPRKHPLPKGATMINTQ